MGAYTSNEHSLKNHIKFFLHSEYVQVQYNLC